MSGVGAMWDQLVNCICRPPRDSYGIDDLVGGEDGTFSLGRCKATRHDLILTNKKGQKLQCSHFIPDGVKGVDGRIPCIIYCHCNSGSRRDAEEALYVLIPLGVSVFTLDFAGSGLSEGDWVTLGAHEVDDVQTVVDYLRASGKTSTLGLWGRSMGAVTALLYSARDPSIAGMVVDSPFSRLTDLMLEIVEEQHLPIPKALCKAALAIMKRSVRKRAGFEISEVAPLDVVPQSFIPILFGHAHQDTFIHIHHSERLHNAYAGDKNFIKFDGDHNSRRPDFFYNSAAIFFHNTLQLDTMLEGGNPLSSGFTRRNGDGVRGGERPSTPAEGLGITGGAPHPGRGHTQDTWRLPVSTSAHWDDDGWGGPERSLKGWGDAQGLTPSQLRGMLADDGGHLGSEDEVEEEEDAELMEAIRLSLAESARAGNGGEGGVGAGSTGATEAKGASQVGSGEGATGAHTATQPLGAGAGPGTEPGRTRAGSMAWASGQHLQQPQPQQHPTPSDWASLAHYDEEAMLQAVLELSLREAQAAAAEAGSSQDELASPQKVAESTGLQASPPRCSPPGAPQQERQPQEGVQDLDDGGDIKDASGKGLDKAPAADNVSSQSNYVDLLCDALGDGLATAQSGSLTIPTDRSDQ